jgi:hypothetical protein
MKLFGLFLLMSYSTFLMSQSLISEAEKIKTLIAQEKIEDHLQSGGKTPLSGEYLESLIPQEEIDHSQTCEEEKEAHSSNYEVIFVAQRNDMPSSLKVMPSIKKDHLSFAKNLLKYAAKSTLSEDELVSSMTSLIQQQYTDEEDRYNALAAYSKLLYKNYNESRNPGRNTKKNNPHDKPLPKGDMTLNEISKAAFEKDKYSGGVCNDISEAIALMGEQLFPDKDVLILNSGSHLGVVISDGEKNRIIDGNFQMELENDLRLNPKLAATNLRIGKMNKGQLKQIAVVDSETGMMMERAFDTGKPILQTSADISSVISHFGFKRANDERTHQVTGAIGVGDLARSKMYVVVAKYNSSTKRWKNYAGVGGSLVERNLVDDPRYQIHLRSGSEFTHIKYVNPRVIFNLASGVQFEGMYGFRPPDEKSTRHDTALGLDFFNRADLSFIPGPDFKFEATTEVRVAPGLTSWGNATGAFAKGTMSGIYGTLSNMNLYVNQINVSTGSEIGISDSTSLQLKANYQGSNIGQAIKLNTGVNITAPDGVQVIIFTGYGTTKIPGYKTKESLLVGNNGAVIGAGVKTPSGVSFSTSVKDISRNSDPFAEAGLSVQLGPKAKAKPKPRSPSSEKKAD